MGRKTDLYAKATELGIKGRSKMTADELDAAITNATDAPVTGFQPGTLDVVSSKTADAPAESDAERRANVVAMVGEGYRSMRERMRPEPTTVVPNRADKRRAKRARNLRNDGSPKGGWVKS